MQKSTIKNFAFRKESGIASLISVIIILTVSVVVLGSFALSVSNTLKNEQRTPQSFSAYYASEGALEDTMVRIRKGLPLPSSGPETIGPASVSVSISSVGVSTKTISATAQVGSVYKTNQVTTTLMDGKVGFNYGAQVGDGGLTMNNNSSVWGNIYSNGPISGSSGAYIFGTALAASTSTISSVIVTGNATAYSFSNCTVMGKLTVISGGSVSNCPSKTTANQDTPLSKMPFPMDNTWITAWENQATQGGTVNGNVSLSGITSYGPKKINGNLTIGNNAIVTITGTIYVTGTVTISNNAWVQLAWSYGSKSDVIISEGRVILSNNILLMGSGNPSSFLMVTSLSASQDPAYPAINLNNNALNSILYAPNGVITIANNADVMEVTAYKLALGSNAGITYFSGLQSTQFNMGGTVNWNITGWQEVP